MNSNKNAVKALLLEYKKAIFEMQAVIENISNENLSFIVDKDTENPDCKSIQTILAHVVRSGYSYCVYIRNYRNEKCSRPERINRDSVAEYKKDLNDVLNFTDQTFETILDSELERFTDSEKMKTSWEQVYDIEQIMEHAIVHILRHRRQIENFKLKLDLK